MVSWGYELIPSIAESAGQARSWGICLADISGDGQIDIYLPQHLDDPVFLLGEDGQFRSVVPQYPSDFDTGDHHGACVIDATGDGCPELHQVVGAGGGTNPGNNWFFANDCLGHFEDQAELAGLADSTGRGRLPIWLDMDVDGVPDVLVLNESGGGPSLLLRGNGDGTYQDVGEAWNLPRNIGWTSGTTADLDLDGDSDLVLAGDRLVAFENTGSQFVAVSELDVLGISRATAADFNGDLIPDLAVVTRGPEGDLVGTPLPGHLRYKLRMQEEHIIGFDWHSEADSAWIAPVAGFDYRALATFLGAESVNPPTLPYRIAADDPRLEGMPDLLGQSAGTFLWRDPDGSWHLRVVGNSSEGNFSFDVARGWLHLDAPLESLTNVGFEPSPPPGAPNYLFLGGGNLTFSDVSESSGFRDGLNQSHDVTAADLDNDSDMDLVVANGGVVLNQRDRIYLNDGSGHFLELGKQLGVDPDPLGTGEAVATADLNGDGAPELVIVEGYTGVPFTGGVQAYSPVGTRNHWIGVQLRPSETGHTELGAHIRMRTGDLIRERHANAGQSHHSQDDPRIFFGLGNVEVVDSLVVRWGSGETQIATDLDANQVIDTENLETPRTRHRAQPVGKVISRFPPHPGVLERKNARDAPPYLE